MTKLNIWKAGLLVSMACTAMLSISDAQVFTTLADFDGTDGTTPYYGGLAQGTDGNLFGTTVFGA
jgi:cyclophilin family peptidyl-prolyl cis-trans isomerase